MRLVFRDWTSIELMSLGLCLAGLSWTAVCGLQAARLSPLPEPGPRAPGSALADTALITSPRDAGPATPAILAAIHRNPMRPDRRRADGRYGARATPEQAAPAEPRRPVPAFRVVGVVRHPGGRDLAAIAWDRAPSQLVRLGEEVQGFRLNRVADDSVYLAREDTAVSLAAPDDGYSGEDR